MVYFDPDKIDKILTNLISNAFKYTDPCGEVTVSIRCSDSEPDDTAGTVEIKVSDTGKGISEDKLDKIFDRFYRVNDPDTGEFAGAGLGLALAKELVDLYRGSITVESESGKGSMFTVNLPVSAAQFRKEEFIKHPAGEIMWTDLVAPAREKAWPRRAAAVAVPAGTPSFRARRAKPASCQTFPGRYRPRFAVKNTRRAALVPTSGPPSSFTRRPQREAEYRYPARRTPVARRRRPHRGRRPERSKAARSARLNPTALTMNQVTNTVRDTRPRMPTHLRTQDLPGGGPVAAVEGDSGPGS